MTLILAMGNQRNVVLVSDRRISRNGQVVSLADEPEGDESNKVFILRLRNARLAVAYTGLAGDGKEFLAKRWLTVALTESAPPDSLMAPTIERFACRATQDFKALSVAPPLDKRMSIVLAGYCDDEFPPRCYLWLVSNYERCVGLCGETQAADKPWENFEVSSIREKRPTEESFASIFIAGADRAVSHDSEMALFDMLQQDKPAVAILGKGVDVIREAARSPRSANTIGEQCSSIVLPSDPELDPLVDYHSAIPTSRTFRPTIINAAGDESGAFIIAEPMVEARDGE